MSGLPSSNNQAKSRSHVAMGIFGAWAVALVALSLGGWIGQATDSALGDQSRYVMQAVIAAVVSIVGIWWLRTRRDGLTLAGMGAPWGKESLRFFGIGLGLVTAPVVFTVILTQVMGWGTVTLNFSSGALTTLGVGLVTVFLGESVLEELIFRGYIFHSLNTRMSRLAAGLIAVALFVLFPLVLVPIQRNLLGLEISIGGAASITGGYIITLTIFGWFVQYLRILSGSIWMGMGFHLAFVLMNRVVGPRPDALIHFADSGQGGPIQMTLMLALLSLLLLVFAWPRIRGERLDWGARATG